MNKHHVGVLVEKNAFVDEGDGLIRFPNKLVITDESEHRNGIKYDINSLDLSEFNPNITVDHDSRVEKIVGKVQGLAKVGNKVIVDAIQYAVKESAMARLVYDLTKGGYSTEFSTETYGSPLGNDNVYYNAKLYGLSQVVGRNNVNAEINELVVNSINQSKKDGLDVSEVEEEFLSELKINQKHEDVINKKEEDMKYTNVKNTRGFPVTIKYKNADGEDEEKIVEPDRGVDIPEEQQNAVQKQYDEAVKPEKDLLKEVENMFDSKITTLKEELEKNAFDKGAQEPGFTSDKNARGGSAKGLDKYKGMDWEERAVNQIESFRLMEKTHDPDAAKTLHELNQFNLDELKKEGLVKNAITIGDLGNYVISPEQLSEIVGFRSNYRSLVDLFSFRETLSTVTQWLKRNGDINMTHVDYDPASITDAGYLKPVDDYAATLETMELEELAAVTPVANAATRFLAADILSDVNQGYRTDYERKLAQLIVARLEQAVDGNGNSETYNTDTDLASVKDFATVIGAIAEQTPSGRLIMNYKSYWQFVTRATGAGISGPLANLVNTGSQPNIFGIPVTVVPNDLLPTLNTAETKTFVIENANVTVNHAVFYIDPSNFVGRVSGGLQYDLSTDAAYEVSGTVRSAFQRNQIILRGSFFRAGQVANDDEVSGLLSPGVS